MCVDDTLFGITSRNLPTADGNVIVGLKLHVLVIETAFLLWVAEDRSIRSNEDIAEESADAQDHG